MTTAPVAIAAATTTAITIGTAGLPSPSSSVAVVVTGAETLDTGASALVVGAVAGRGRGGRCRNRGRRPAERRRRRRRRGRRRGLGVVDVDDGDELLPAGRVERDVVDRRRRFGALGEDEHARCRELVSRVAADPRQLLAVLAHLDRRERQQHPGCRRRHEGHGKGAFLVGREHPARPLEHRVAGTVGRDRRRPPVDAHRRGVGERRPDTYDDGR